MNISQVISQLQLQSLHDCWDDGPLSGAYTSDLMSDVMAHAKEADLLITIQSHKNTIAVATLVGAQGVIVCNNRPVPEDMLAAARQENIAILVSREDQFSVSGRLYNLLRGE